MRKKVAIELRKLAADFFEALPPEQRHHRVMRDGKTGAILHGNTKFGIYRRLKSLYKSSPERRAAFQAMIAGRISPPAPYRKA